MIVGAAQQVIDMPLLFETGFNKFTRPNILVTCSEDDEVFAGVWLDGRGLTSTANEDCLQVRCCGAGAASDAKRQMRADCGAIKSCSTAAFGQ